MPAQIDDRFGAHLTPGDTVRFRVTFDDSAQVFEVTSEALREHFDAKSGSGEDLMEAFYDAQFDILEAAERKGWHTNSGSVLLEMRDFNRGLG